MIINTYDGWIESKILQLRENAAQAGEAPQLKCTQCFGLGHITDFGELTGEEFDACCPECDGAGTVDFEPAAVDIAVARKVLTRRDYHNELIADLRRVARFTGRDEWLFLAEHGITVYSDIATQKLRVVARLDGDWYDSALEVIH